MREGNEGKSSAPVQALQDGGIGRGPGFSRKLRTQDPWIPRDLGGADCWHSALAPSQTKVSIVGWGLPFHVKPVKT
jgi:hypothetical protein